MRRLALLGLALAALLVPVAVLPGLVSRASAEEAALNKAALPLSTVSVDLAASQGQFPFGPGRQLSATPKSWRHGPQTLAALDALRLERARIWLRFTDTVDPTTRVPDYAKWHDYVATHHSRAGSLLVNWQSGYDPLVTGGTWTADQLFAAQRDMLAHYKQRYPRIEFVEVENEDYADAKDVAKYYPKYQHMYRVVNAVNALGLPGPALKVGGPTTDIFSEWRITAFLDRYAADPAPSKRLDFVSYHQYLTNTDPALPWTALKDYPASVATERARLDSWLTARKLPLVPALVSEVGVFPMTRASDLGIEADWHIQAAALASLHYHYAGQRNVIPFDWTLDHPENDRKDLFVDLASGTPRPYYNAVRALSMLPGTRYRTTSDTLTARGLGVYGLTGADATSVAVMTWNYQWTNAAAYDSRTVIKNFPATFRTSNVRVTRYRIDAGTHAGAMTPVQTLVVGPRTAGTYYSQTLPLEPNELRLMVLTPTTDPVTG